MLAAFKHQQFNNNKSNITELKILKHLYVNIYNNEEEQGLETNWNKKNRYIVFYLFSQKESNHLLDLSKKTRN